MATIDNRLAERLEEQGISLSELHRRILMAGEDMSYNTLSTIKNKQRNDMLLSTAAAICSALGLSLDDVFPLEGPPNGRQSEGG